MSNAIYALVLLFSTTSLVAGCGKHPAAAMGGSSTTTSALGSRFNPYLGVGTDFAQIKTYAQCIVFEPVHAPGRGFDRRPYSETQIYSAHHLDEQLDISAVARARALWGGGGIAAHYFNRKEVNRADFHWLVDAKYESGREMIRMNVGRGLSLSEEALRIIQNEGIEAFHATCGTHFISSQVLGGQYTLLYTIQSQDQREMSGVTTAADFNGFGLEASASFRHQIEQARNHRALRVDSVSIGGGTEVEAYADDPDELKKVLKRLQQDILDGKGAVLDLGIQSYNIFPEIRDAARRASFDDDDEQRESFLALHLQARTINDKQLASISRAISRSTGDEPFYLFEEKKSAVLDQMFAERLALGEAIRESAGRCLQGTAKCVRPLPPLPEPKIPRPDRDLSGINGWHVMPFMPTHAGQYLDFFAKPVNGGSPRHLSTEMSMKEIGDGLYILAGEHVTGNDAGFVRLGTTRLVVNPVSGEKQFDICVDSYARGCNLRVVPTRGPNGTWTDDIGKLQLTLFNPFGIAEAQFNFLQVED